MGTDLGTERGAENKAGGEAARAMGTEKIAKPVGDSCHILEVDQEEGRQPGRQCGALTHWKSELSLHVLGDLHAKEREEKEGNS